VASLRHSLHKEIKTSARNPRAADRLHIQVSGMVEDLKTAAERPINASRGLQPQPTEWRPTMYRLFATTAAALILTGMTTASARTNDVRTKPDHRAAMHGSVYDPGYRRDMPYRLRENSYQCMEDLGYGRILPCY
jgi:hypothetical protein